jgi:hypothetical protein
VDFDISGGRQRAIHGMQKMSSDSAEVRFYVISSCT